MQVVKAAGVQRQIGHHEDPVQTRLRQTHPPPVHQEVPHVDPVGAIESVEQAPQEPGRDARGMDEGRIFQSLLRQ